MARPRKTFPAVLETDAQEAAVREIAREEIASLCGLLLKRLGELDPGVVDRSELTAIVGEALRDFGGTPDEPGETRHWDEHGVERPGPAFPGLPEATA